MDINSLNNVPNFVVLKNNKTDNTVTNPSFTNKETVETPQKQMVDAQTALASYTVKNTSFRGNATVKFLTNEEKEKMIESLSQNIHPDVKKEIMSLQDEQFNDIYQMVKKGLKDNFIITMYSSCDEKTKTTIKRLFDMGIHSDLCILVSSIQDSKEKTAQFQDILNTNTIQEWLKTDNKNCCSYLSTIKFDDESTVALKEIFDNEIITELAKNKKIAPDNFIFYQPNNINKFAELLKYKNFNTMIKTGCNNNDSYIPKLQYNLKNNYEFLKKLISNNDLDCIFENAVIDSIDISFAESMFNDDDFKNITKLFDNEEIRKINNKFKLNLMTLYYIADSPNLSTFNADKLLANDKILKNLIERKSLGTVINKWDKFNFDKVVEMFDESYSVEVKTIQNGGGVLLVAKKTDNVPDEITQVVKTDTNGNISKSITKTNNDSVQTIYSEKNRLVTIKKAKNGIDIKSQIELIMNDKGETEYVIHIKESEKLKGAYEITRYDAGDYPNDFDILKAVEEGTITGGKPLSKVTTDEIGNTIYEQNFEYNGSNIKRNYSQKVDRNGKLNSTQYHYHIMDNENNNLLSLDRSWQMNKDGTTTTIINNKTYKADFNDDNMTVKITLDNGIEKNIDIKNKMGFYEYNDYAIKTFGSEENMNKAMFDFVKTLPADILLDIDNYISRIFITDPIDSSSANSGTLSIGFDLPITAHELGHSVDFENSKMFDMAGKISRNKELISIYNEEMKVFNANYTEPVQDVIGYFTQQGGGKANTGLSEFVAETNMLLTTYGNDVETLRTRAIYLVHYFPKTIAKIVELLGCNKKCPISE